MAGKKKGKASDGPDDYLDIRGLRRLTFDAAKGVASKISGSNEFLANGLDLILERQSGVERMIREVFSFIPSKIRKYARVIIPFLLMAFVLSLSLPVQPEIKKSLALFVCIGFLWGLESIPLVVTAILVPVLVVMLGLGSESEALSSFSHPMIYLLFGGLVIAEAFRKHSLDRKIAVRLLSSSGGGAAKVLFLFMAASGLLGMWMSNTATVALLMPVVISLSSSISVESRKKMVSVLLLGIGIASSVAGMATMTGSTPNAITAAFISESGRFTFFDWMRSGIILSALSFLISYALLVMLFRLKGMRIDVDSPHEEKAGLTYEQRKTLIIFIPTILMWIFGQELAQSLGLSQSIFHPAIVSLVSVVMLFTFRVIDWSDARGISWHVLLLTGGGLALGKAIMASGASRLISDVLLSRFSGLPVLLMLLIIIYFTVFLSNFVNNSSAVIILVPTLMELANSLGINPILFALAASHATAVSFITPISIPAFSLLYGTGLIDRKDMIRTGMVLAIVNGVMIAVVLIAVFGPSMLFQ